MAALNELRLLINHPKIDKYILPIEVLGIADNEISFIESLKVAFENRRDYERAKKTIKAKKIKFNMKRNERWPQLDFEGSLKLNGVERLYKDAAADAFTHENPEYYAKMTFSFPFEDREAKSAYNKSKYEKAKALIDFKKVEKTIVTEIDDIARKVNVYKDKAMQSIRIEELQKKKLEEEERQFRYGRSDSDRIIRFQEDLLIAKLRALDSLNAYKDFLIDLYLTQDTYLDKKGLTVP
ncbi:MAG: TolC family protein [Candidatus Omnitrophica bacterium]|nr:TolC family protein [Candidatus Omnitrophota bacterium]